MAHPGENRFICKSCSRSFRRVEHLRRHETTHTGMRSHVCPNCKSTFFRGDVLVRHMRNVHRAVVSGVKELRMAEKATLASHSSSAAGTSSLNEGLYTYPNINRTCGRSESTIDTAQPLPHEPVNTEQSIKDYTKLYLTPSPYIGFRGHYNNPWEENLHFRSDSSNGFTPQPTQQLYPAYSAPPSHVIQQYVRHPPRNGLPISTTSKITSTANPPMETLIAYGYGPYAPNVKGWTDTALNATPPIPTGSTHAVRDYEKHPETYFSGSTDHLKDGRVAKENINKSDYRKNNDRYIDIVQSRKYAPLNNILSPAVAGFSNRDQYLDFIPINGPSWDSSRVNKNAQSRPVAQYALNRTSPGETESRRENEYSKTAQQMAEPIPSDSNKLYQIETRMSATLPKWEYNRESGMATDGIRRLENIEVIEQNSTQNNTQNSTQNGIQRAKRPSSSLSADQEPVNRQNKHNEVFSKPNEDALGDIFQDLENDKDTVSSLSSSLITDISSKGEKIDDETQTTEVAQNNTIPRPSGEADIAIHVKNILRKRVDARWSETFLERYLTYHNNYSHHIMPIIHKPTFDPYNSKPALLFAICALSASVLQDLDMAKLLYSSAERLLQQDWDELMNLRQEILGVDEWLYYIQTSLYMQWQCFAFASSAENLAKAFQMRDFQAKIISFFPGIDLSANELDKKHEEWIREQAVCRGFCALMCIDYVSVSSYGLEPRTRSILEACRHLPVPCTEDLWNTRFESETEWKTKLVAEESEQSNPRTFDALLNSLETFDIDRIKQSLGAWKLTPMCLMAFTTFLFSECGDKWSQPSAVQLPKEYSDILRLVYSQLQEPSLSPMVDNFNDKDGTQATQNSNRDVAQDSHSYKLVTSWQKVWQDQHPLVALTSMVVESSRCGIFMNVDQITDRVRAFDEQGITHSVLQAMHRNKERDLSKFLPVVSIIVDFVQFALASGAQGTMGFNKLYSASFTRTVSVLLGHRSLTFFCCWVFAIESRITSGAEISGKELEIFRIVERSCLDYENQDMVSQKRKIANIMRNSAQPADKNTSAHVALPVTATIMSLLGTSSNDSDGDSPILPYYHALRNISSFLTTNENLPAEVQATC